jgi:hypothetical protein
MDNCSDTFSQKCHNVSFLEVMISGGRSYCMARDYLEQLIVPFTKRFPVVESNIHHYDHKHPSGNGLQIPYFI